MSRTALEMPEVLAARISLMQNAGASPQWLPPAEDVKTVLLNTLANWLKAVSEIDALFKKNVHENENLTELDLRQHRSWICRLIADGELLAIGINKLGETAASGNEFASMIDITDQQLKRLLAMLFEWHAPLSAQLDVPEDFKQSMQELEQGKIEDLKI